MKRKWLLLSLAPLALASCGGAVSSTFEAIRDKIGALPSSASYPYYRVVGMMDFNNEILEVEQTFKEAPIDGEFVPYARYNEGFYNAAMDGVEPNPADILIYGMASRSYWLRAPLRLTADNFYKTIALDRGSGTFDGLAFDVNYSTGQIGTIGDEITGARLAKVDDSHVSLTYMKGEEQTVLNFARSGEGDPEAFYAGKLTLSGIDAKRDCDDDLAPEICFCVPFHGNSNYIRNWISIKMTFCQIKCLGRLREMWENACTLKKASYFEGPVQCPQAKGQYT